MDELILKIKQLIKKKSIKNGIWLYALQFFNTILPLATVPYITRILGAYEYGIFSITLNHVSYLQVIVEYGFALSATRKVAFLDDDNMLQKLFSSVISARFILYFLSLIITGIYDLYFPSDTESRICLWILSISLIGYCFQMNWLFQGKQEMKFISITNMTARIITTILIFAFVNKPEDVVLYCVLYSLSPIISNILGTIIGIEKYRLKWIWLSFSEIADTLKDGVYVFFTNLSSKVFGAIGVTFLGIFSNAYDVGIYNALYKIPYLLLLLWSPITQIIYPITSKRIAESYEEGKKLISKIRKYCLAMFGVVSLLIGVLAEPISRIAFGQDYSAKFYIIYPLLLWVLLGINNNFLGIQTLVASGHDKEYGRAFQIGVAVTVIFNYILIQRWGIIGAATAPVLSEGILSIILLWEKKNIEQNK